MAVPAFGSMIGAMLRGDAITAKASRTPGELARILDPRTVQTPALQLIDDKLMQVASGEVTRLIISFAPQEGKSSRCSHYFPLWMLKNNPDLRLGEASYEQRIATRWGRAVRNSIKSHPELGLRLSDDTTAAHEWSIEGRIGGMYSVGIGGALTGRPLDGLVIDDPVKGRAEADSEAYRDAAWDWWTDVARTRLSPGAFVVLIMTRWHEDDLAGRLVERDEDEQWVQVTIPAQADHRPEKGEVDPLGREPGEWMVSARGRTTDEWEQTRRDVGDRTFVALYQGRPAPVEGGLFKKSHWRRYDISKAVLRDDGTWWVQGADQVIQSWDMTFKDTKGSDWVVGQVWARFGLDAHLMTQVRARLSFTRTLAELQRLSAEWPQTHLKLVEEKANGAAIIDMLKSKVSGLVAVNPQESKYARASAVSPHVESGHVWIPSEAVSWVQGFVDEHAQFPNSAYDDQVDATSQGLDRLLGHPVTVKVRRPPATTGLPTGFGAAMGGRTLGVDRPYRP